MWATITADEIAKLPDRVLNGVATNVSLPENSTFIEAEGWKKCIDRLLEIRLLEDDWDGHGSPAPAPELVDSAIILAVLLRQKHVKPPNHTVQDVQGGVNLHWSWPDYTTLDIEVMEPFHADVFLLSPGRPVEHWELGEVVAV